jgi:hypothetical protein
VSKRAGGGSDRTLRTRHVVQFPTASIRTNVCATCMAS